MTHELSVGHGFFLRVAIAPLSPDFKPPGSISYPPLEGCCILKGFTVQVYQYLIALKKCLQAWSVTQTLCTTLDTTVHVVPVPRVISPMYRTTQASRLGIIQRPELRTGLLWTRSAIHPDGALLLYDDPKSFADGVENPVRLEPNHHYTTRVSQG